MACSCSVGAMPANSASGAAWEEWASHELCNTICSHSTCTIALCHMGCATWQAHITQVQTTCLGARSYNTACLDECVEVVASVPCNQTGAQVQAMAKALLRQKVMSSQMHNCCRALCLKSTACVCFPHTEGSWGTGQG